MSVEDIIREVSIPTFYTRVAFIALKVAQNVGAEDPAAENHKNRLDYAGRVMRGEDRALLLAMHVASSNSTIAQTLETEGGKAVPDGDIEFALASIWDARSNAFVEKPPAVAAAPVVPEAPAAPEETPEA